MLTGVDSPASALAARTTERPDFLIPNLGALYRPYPALEPVDGGFRCGTVTARVSGGEVLVDAPERAIWTDGALRAPPGGRNTPTLPSQPIHRSAGLSVPEARLCPWMKVQNRAAPPQNRI